MPGLLATKLHTPTPPQRTIPRAYLLRQLKDGLDLGRRLTLVSAPAGFGKTTCMIEWINHARLDPLTWLSVDAADDDPERFFPYLVAALQKIHPIIGQEISASLQSGTMPTAEAISTSLINDISAVTRNFWLVIDDFHLVQNRVILQVFERLIASLPPPLRLVLLTREDPALPLARMRANNQLTEIRADDLRFSREETRAFFKDIVGLSLSEADIETLSNRTEGWVAGLQLVGLSIQGHPDPSRFINTLSGSHRYILSYLTEEVLSRQPEEIQDFLLRTSILENLTGDLCDAVAGRRDSAALLERLLSANLFLTPLDEEQRWYRYHNLFRELLRSRPMMVKGDLVVESHRRASRWFAQACLESSLSERSAYADEAVRHALAIADDEFAAHVIEANAMEIIDQWHAKTVHAWMQSLPPEWIARSPRANLAFAQMYLMRGDHLQASPYLERLQAIFSNAADGVSDSAGEPGLQARWLVLQATAFNAQGKPSEAVEMAQKALERAPKEDSDALGQAYLALANAYQQLEDPQRAEVVYQKLIQLGQASGNLITELLGLSSLALLVITRGRLHYAFELASLGADKLERAGGRLPIGIGLYGELAQVAFEWYHLDEAEHYFQRAEQLSASSGISDAGIYHAIFRSRMHQARGNLDAAAHEIETAARLMRADAPYVVREEVIAQQINIALALHHFTEAEHLLGSEIDLPETLPAPDFPYSQGVLYVSALRMLFDQARREQRACDAFGTAIGLANRLLDSFLQRQYISLALETRLLRSQIMTYHGDLQSALADISSALDLAEPEGYISAFVVEGSSIADSLRSLLRQSQPGTSRSIFIRKILTYMPDHPELIPPHQTAVVEPLTDREIEVLRLIAAGQTYDSMAQRLVVSINTIRSHIKSIYGKLGVNNRTAAVEAARQMGIL